MELDDVLALLREGGGQGVAQGYKSAREPRLRTFRTIQIESGGYSYEAIVRNISSRGALIEGLWNVPVGTDFRLDFGGGTIVEAQARWTVEDRVGLRFSEAIDMENFSGQPVRVGISRAA